MKKILLTASALFAFGLAHSQMINDHKITFSYIQLPLVKVDNQHTSYDLKVEHNYNQANEDSLTVFNARKDAALAFFELQMDEYHRDRDSLDRIYFTKLSGWEKNVNAGIKNADGTPLAKPAPPAYPMQPVFPRNESPQLHSVYDDANVDQRISLSGFDKGTGGVEVTVKIQPIRNIRIVSKKTGTGASTKYTYTAQYVLPMDVVIATPTQGILLEQTMFTNMKTYKIADHKSQYDHEIYMMDHETDLFLKLEAHARNEGLNSINSIINNQFGFVTRSRSAEIYSVKKYKNYDYTDVTSAFSLATLALTAVGDDRDRSGAMDKLDDAINAIKLILEESTPDNKARVNPKVTAMLQCNLAELLIWQAEFDKADATVNIAMNSGEGKAKRHCKDELGFYKDQRKRWKVNY